MLELGKADHEKNVKVLAKLDGRASGSKNALAVPAKSLKEVGAMAEHLGKATAQCKSLKDKGYLRTNMPAERSQSAEQPQATHYTQLRIQP